MLEEKKQKKLKICSKVVSIISFIGMIGCIIGVSCITLAMVVVPICTSNIKVENKSLKVFGEKIKYERDDNKITLSHKDDSYDVTGKAEVFALNAVLDYLEENNLNKVTLVAELAFVSVFVTLVILFFTLHNLRGLAKNINKEDTPFTMDNVTYIHKISCYLIVLLVLPWITSLIIQVIVGSKYSTNFNFVSLTGIFIAFGLSYIFEYGCKLQAKSDLKVYS